MTLSESSSRDARSHVDVGDDPRSLRRHLLRALFAVVGVCQAQIHVRCGYTVAQAVRPGTGSDAFLAWRRRGRACHTSVLHVRSHRYDDCLRVCIQIRPSRCTPDPSALIQQDSDGPPVSSPIDAVVANVTTTTSHHCACPRLLMITCHGRSPLPDLYDPYQFRAPCMPLSRLLSLLIIDKDFFFVAFVYR